MLDWLATGVMAGAMLLRLMAGQPGDAVHLWRRRQGSVTVEPGGDGSPASGWFGVMVWRTAGDEGVSELDEAAGRHLRRLYAGHEGRAEVRGSARVMGESGREQRASFAVMDGKPRSCLLDWSGAW